MSSSKKESSNNIAWRQIFEQLHLLEEIAAKGRVPVSASEIKRISNREPRLMTKFDNRSQLPEIFSKNNLSILPISRGGYVISSFETFCNFNKEDVAVTSIEFPMSLESLDYKDITSEATAINCTYVAEILQHFTGEEHLLPTVSGRMGSSKFDFNINTLGGALKVEVDNSQIEIDGGYEGYNSLVLIEAKNYISEDFLIRQLYYPYRLWRDKVRKQVRPVFLTYSNGIFHLREYTFTDLESYNSIQLVRHNKYAVQEGAINIESIQNVLERVRIVNEPESPSFPQADSFERVINLCELLRQRGFISKDEIAENYDFGSHFDPRQADYYSNAGRYLGLIENVQINGKRMCVLTNAGERLFDLSIIERQFEFIRLILSHRVFNMVLRSYFDNSSEPLKEEVVEIMKESNLKGIDKSTYGRRASTAISWVNWILRQINE